MSKKVPTVVFECEFVSKMCKVYFYFLKPIPLSMNHVKACFRDNVIYTCKCNFCMKPAVNLCTFINFHAFDTAPCFTKRWILLA